MKQKRIIILIGPPGSGKGTQADLLVQKNKYNQLSPGMMLREEIRNKTAIGRQAAPYVKSGKLVPGNLVVEIMLGKIKHSRRNIILDGFPRSLDQAEILDKFFKARAFLKYVLEIDVPNSDIYKRIGGRRSCNCGKVYHLELNPPKKRGLCDACGAKLKTRSDSKEAVIRERIGVYDNQTRPLIKFYKKRKEYEYIKVDGRPEIKKVHERIYKKLMD